MRARAGLLCGLVLVASAARADDGGWHTLQVPGGRATLRALGVDDTRERAGVMIELVRRLHFPTTPPLGLQAAVRRIPVTGAGTLTLPMPMSHRVWETAVFRRSVDPSRLFFEILNDPSARLLFHGLSGLDAATRQWIETAPAVVRAIYRDPDAARAFAMFAPAIQVAGGRVRVPGAELGEARWSTVLNAGAADPERFVTRLFVEREARASGLYALMAAVDRNRRQFLLGSDQRSAERFEALVSTFASCYPRNANDYPFVVRSKDPALLLMYLPLTDGGVMAGPRSRAFWERVFAANSLIDPGTSAAAGDVDAAWLVGRLCATPTIERPGAFASLLAGPRVFADLPPGEEGEAIIALRVRRMFPSAFMMLERAGVRRPAVFVAAGRAAANLDRIGGTEDAVVTIQQLQGALAIAIGARASGALDDTRLLGLLNRLAAVPVRDERYDGRLAAWFADDLLKVLGHTTDAGIEDTIARAIAGPPPARPLNVRWEELDYVVDHPATVFARLRAVRAKQGGESLDSALERVTAARDPGSVRTADAGLGRVLASWAYAPHIGGPDSGALLGGDGSARHDLGVRQINRTRYEQRWDVALASGDRGSVAGSYLGLEASLAVWSLRRLSADRIPPEPTISANDRMALFAAVSLSDSRALTDADMQRIASALGSGTQALDAAGNDAERLYELAGRTSMSPWRREALAWMAAEEPDRVREQFSTTARAQAGGLALGTVGAWGTSAIASGCLCVAAPPLVYPEMVAGRPADGIVGAQSADLMLRVAELLTELKLPASLATSVLAYAMRDHIDRVRPSHPADVDALARPAPALTRAMVEDYVGAIAAVGPLQPARQ